MAPPDANQLPFSRLPATDRRKDAIGDGPARTTVYEKRSYAVTTVAQAKQVARNYLAGVGVDSALIRFGLPEVDDRYHIWRVPLVNGPANERVGQDGLAARQRQAQAHGQHQFGVGEVDDDVAHGPAVAGRTAVEGGGLGAVDGRAHERRSAREACEGVGVLVGDARHGRSVGERRARARLRAAESASLTRG